MAFSPLIQLLMSVYGWQTTFGILASIGPITILVSCLLRPLAIELIDIEPDVSLVEEVENAEEQKRQCNDPMWISSPKTDQVSNNVTVYNLNGRRSSRLDLLNVTNDGSIAFEKRLNGITPPAQISVDSLENCQKEQLNKKGVFVFDVPEGASLALKPMERRRPSICIRPVAKNNVYYNKSTSTLDSNIIDDLPTIQEFSPQVSSHLNLPSKSRRKSTMVMSSLDIERVDTNSISRRLSMTTKINIKKMEHIRGWSAYFAPIKTIWMEMFDFSCLRERTFVLLLLSNFLSNLAYLTPFMFLPSLMISKGSIAPHMASLAITAIGASNIFGRILSGILVDLKMISPICIISLSCFVSGACILGFEFCTTYVAYIVTSLIFGLFSAPFITTVPVLLVDMYGIERLTTNFGFLTFIRGIALSLGPPILSAIFDLTHEYSTELNASCGLFTLAAIFCSIVGIKNYSCKKTFTKKVNNC